MAAAFHALLRREAPAATAIHVLGDLFEAWVGDDDDDAFNEATVAALAEASRHTTVRLLHGNRDFMLGKRFVERTGAILDTSPVRVRSGAREFLLCHGDELCTADTRYQEMRLMFRSPAWQADILKRPLDERRALADGLRAQSRAANANKPDRIMDVTVAAVDDLMREHQVRTLVHGHTHRPGIHRFTLDGAAAERIVLGDWTRCGWLLRLLDDDYRLECFATGS